MPGGGGSGPGGGGGGGLGRARGKHDKDVLPRQKSGGGKAGGKGSGGKGSGGKGSGGKGSGAKMGGVLRAGAARGALGGGGWRLNASADRAAGRLLRRANASASQARAKPARERLLDVEALYKEGLVSDEERQALRRRVLDLVVQGLSPAAKGVGLPGLAAQRARG